MNKIIIAILFLAACMPKEEPIQAYDRGDIKEVFINSGPTKNTVVFYNLESNSVVAQSSPDAWDIYIGKEEVKVNFHRFVHYASFTEDFDIRTDTIGLNFVHGQREENQWVLKPNTSYVLDLGLGSNAKHLGFYKLSYDLQSGMKLKWAKLESTSSLQMDIVESYFNLRDSAEIDLPASTDYDLSFGKYLHYFEVEKLDYEVYGAISSQSKVKELSVDFAAIDASSIDTLSWDNTRADEIGYDWKYYSLDKNAYEIDPLKNYIIKNNKGFIYKLRFVNFYDQTGQSGHPSFEFKLL